MVGLIIATSIPVTQIIKHNVSASNPNPSNEKFFSTVAKDDVNQNEVSNAIELALYQQVEFFGTSTFVPYPTVSSRNQLLELTKRYPQNTFIYKKLADLEIELGEKNLAEKYLLIYVKLSKNSQSLRDLSNFYKQEAQFDKQADTLNKMLEVVSSEAQVEILKEIIYLADKHLLNQYLGAQFYQQVLKRYPSNLLILEEYIDKLIQEKEYKKALKIVTDYRNNIPDNDYYFLNKQAGILLEMDKWQEAKELYIKAFDPFWPDEVNQKFYYDVLSDNEQLRVYGRQLRKDFEKNPGDFNLAIRLIHYDIKNPSYYSDSTDISQYVFYKLEEARSKTNIGWQANELGVLARLSLQKGYAERASRYIYTLYNQGELKPSSELRGKLLYQLFELLMDAEYERLPLTTGNLNFYQDIAKVDTNPGVIGGILSLIFSDTKPQEEFSKAKTSATKYFNQSAAYRIFQTYKTEHSTSPQLAQMYLDLVSFYTKEGNTELAHQTLKEFELRYKDSNKLAEVAIKLADAYITTGEEEKELFVYKEILDYLGKNVKAGELFRDTKNDKNRKHYVRDDYENESQTRKDIEPPTLVEPTNYKPETSFPEFKQGLKINQPSEDKENYYYEYEELSFSDYLAESQDINYKLVLNRYVFKLNKKNRTKEIIEFFNGEIKKYPKEELLYEQLLQWLGQTNLVEDQLAVYQSAIKAFPTTSWYDRLARWLLRQSRNEEFAVYSKELLSKFDEERVADYLSKFITSYTSNDFDKKLYLSLYKYAHNRFPQNRSFVQGLLNYYSFYKEIDKWQALVGKYYFIWPEVRNDYLTYLSKNGELRKYLSSARTKLVNSPENSNLLPYKLFRADAAIWLCNYEEAIDAYRELNNLYPGNSVLADQLVKLSRSFGQIQPKFLTEATKVQLKEIFLRPGSIEDRIRVGELYAEMNDYKKAKIEWLKLLDLGKDKQTYLDVATVFWDYYQYDDALKTIEKLRKQQNDETLLAFEMGAILEAKHQTNAAIKEYVKGLSRDNEQFNKTKNRLAILYRRDDLLSKEIEKAFSLYSRQTKSPEKFVLGYIKVLEKVDEKEKAAQLLKRKIKETKSRDFLEQARYFFQEIGDQESEIKSIELQLKQVRSLHEDISYHIELIEVYRKKNEKEKITKALQNLLIKYPLNYGVINQAVNTYWNIGLTNQAITTLQQATKRSQGKFRYEFSRRLAARELDLNNTKVAQNILEKLFAEDELNSDVIEALVNLYIRTDNHEALEKVLKTGLKAVESQYIDPSELKHEIAYFRRHMIDSFTSIRDYSAAIKQYIEIINRNPDDEEKLEEAILYTERYGGGDELANYYKKLFQEAYKNYRWAVVLTRIYKAKGDLENAVKYSLAAIDNQPEKAELYALLAQTYEEKEDLPSAIKAIKKAMELSNYDITYTQETIRLLEEANQNSEATLLKAKLPAKTEKTKEKIASEKDSQVAGTFALADELKNNKDKEAITKYRQAFQEFYDNPYSSLDVGSYSLNSYAQVIHKEDSLSKILENFWGLREKLLKEATLENSYNAGKARTLLQMMDGALPKTLGDIVQTESTGEELVDLHKNLTNKLESLWGKPDPYQTMALLENIAVAANFIDLKEHLLKRLYEKNKGESLDKLIYFYETQNNYQKALDILEQEYASTKATHHLYQIARLSALAGDKAKELKALNAYYEKHIPASSQAKDSPITYYFDLVYKNSSDRKEEFLKLIKIPSMYQMQLINFLISKKEIDLAHRAISNSKLFDLWKDSRNAELSIKLGDYRAINNQYFENILDFQNIGQIIKNKPKASNQLIGDDWFEMAYNYGKWLYKTPNASKKLTANMFLPAMLERRPEDAIQQQKLGEWYLEEKQLDKALSHLLNAQKMGVESAQLLSSIGSAYFLKGNKDKALDYWLRLFSKNEFESDQLWLDTLKKYGLIDRAREELLKRFIEKKPALSVESINSYLLMFANSFKEDGKLNVTQTKAQAEFLLNLCKIWPEDTSITTFFIEQGIISVEEMAPFYQILIERSNGFESYEYDHKYRNKAKAAKNLSLLEEELDHDTSFYSKEIISERYNRQTAYLQLLIAQNKDKLASELIKEMEISLARRFMRPESLRLASIQLMLRVGDFESAWKELLHFVKIETYPETTNVVIPSLERLEKALYILDKTSFVKEKNRLLQAYYERLLALEQCSLSNLSGFADAVYSSGNSELGNELFKIILEFAESKTQVRAAKKLANLPSIKSRTITERSIVTPAPTYESVYSSVSTIHLQVVAELATKHGLYSLAIEQRRRLKQESSDDINRLELARLLAFSNQTQQAVEEIISLINDSKNVNRSNRWLAMSLLSKIANKDSSLWKLIESVTDKELKLALEANQLATLGEIKSAIKLIDKKFNSVEMKFFQAILERKNNNPRAAIELLSQIPADYKPFDVSEASPLRQMIYLYSVVNSPKAVLTLIEKDPQIQSLLYSGAFLGKNGFIKEESIQLLSTLEQEQKRKTTLDLLALAASAAEKLEDFEPALKFLNSLKNISNLEAQTKIKAHIEELEQKRKPENQNASNWQIDVSLMSK